MKLVILLPAYNEERTVGDVIRSLPKSLDGISEIIYLVVDDGSTDRTASIATEAGARVQHHTRNRGLGDAFNTGLAASLDLAADIMVTMDADGQFDPADIPALIGPILAKRADFVPGDRFTKSDGSLYHPEYMSKIKFWGNQRMSDLISFLARRKFADVSGGYRAYSREAMLRLNLTGGFNFSQESFLDLANKGMAIETVPIAVRYFPDRKSKVADNILKYMWRTIKIIFRAFRDYSPMRFFGILGLFPGILGALMGIFVIIHYIVVGSFTPFKALGFIGIFLLALAILFWVVGLLADMFVRIRLNQEKILYFEKSRRYFGE